MATARFGVIMTVLAACFSMRAHSRSASPGGARTSVVGVALSTMETVVALAVMPRFTDATIGVGSSCAITERGPPAVARFWCGTITPRAGPVVPEE